MTPDDIRARLHADFRVAHALSNADRPAGLTASRLLGCPSQAARILLQQPPGTENDVYRGLRGKWMHDGLNDDLALVDPGFTDGRKERFTWDPGGGLPVVTGAYDLLLDGVPVEIKTAAKEVCRWHADHGARPEHAAQVSAAAVAVKATQAFVVYLPNDAGFDEIAVCEVDPHHWARETVQWLHRVDVRHEVEAAVERGTPRDRAVAQALDPIPREPPVAQCRMMCPWVQACRGDYVIPPDLEVLDPTIRKAAAELEHWRDIRLNAEKKEKAAKAVLAHAEGVVHDEQPDPLRIEQRHVEAKPGRRGHTKTVVTRRPE